MIFVCKDDIHFKTKEEYDTYITNLRKLNPNEYIEEREFLKELTKKEKTIISVVRNLETYKIENIKHINIINAWESSKTSALNSIIKNRYGSYEGTIDNRIYRLIVLFARERFDESRKRNFDIGNTFNKFIDIMGISGEMAFTLLKPFFKYNLPILPSPNGRDGLRDFVINNYDIEIKSSKYSNVLIRRKELEKNLDAILVGCTFNTMTTFKIWGGIRFEEVLKTCKEEYFYGQLKFKVPGYRFYPLEKFLEKKERDGFLSVAWINFP